MKKYLYILIALSLLSCSSKIVEDHLYITKKYHGTVITADTLVRERLTTQGSMLITTDSCSFIIKGNCYIQEGERVYIHLDPQYRGDSAPLATIGTKQYKLR